MKLKKVIYLLSATILGIVLSFILHAVIELIYLQTAEETNISWNSIWGKGTCSLPVWLQVGLLIVGIVGGYLLGRWWWRIVYLERRHWKSINKNKNKT